MPHSGLVSRRKLLGAAAAGALGSACSMPTSGLPAAATGPQRLRLLGEALLPHGLRFGDTTVGGLSGIDHDPATGLWVAISDDRSELQPARFYTLDLTLAPSGLAVELLDVVTLRDARGAPFPRRRAGGEVVDPEAIRLLPQRQGVLWTSEGDARVQQSPSLRLAGLDGRQVRDFAIPPHLQFARRGGAGPRRNKTFEGLALTPDGRTAWVAMEAALEQDGPVPAPGRAGGPCRFTAFDLASGRAVRQLAYLPDAVPQASPVPGGFTDNGVSEILMVDGHRMLVLERAYILALGTSLRLYDVDTRAGSDTLGTDTLVAGGYRPLPKRLVADFAQLGLGRLDNTEGLCWGPRLPGGRRTLVCVSDDNFRYAQVTQFAAFEFLEDPST